MRKPAGLLALSLLLLIGPTALADTLLGTISISTALAESPQANHSFLRIQAGPYDSINITCGPCFVADFTPSNSPQSLDFTAADPNFAAIAADFTGSLNSWTFLLQPDGLPFAGNGAGPWGALGATVDRFTITISGFQFYQKEACDFGFNTILPCTVTAGTSGPPVFEGYPLFTVTVEAFGTPAPVPEPTSALLLASGLVALWRRRSR